MILVEMVHDVRIIRMNAQHDPAAIQKWLGDSIGHWEGDTLVVETINFLPENRFRGSSDQLKVTERFRRVDANTILYRATMDDPNKPPFAANFFTGVPAPLGAITVLLPIYLAFVGVPKPPVILTALFTLVIAFLMISRLPVFSGKTVRMRVPPEMVLPVFVSVVFFIALLISYPWYILSAGSALYLLSLPAGWKSYRDHERKAAASVVAPAGVAPSNPAPPFPPPAAEPEQDNRPARLN